RWTTMPWAGAPDAEVARAFDVGNTPATIARRSSPTGSSRQARFGRFIGEPFLLSTFYALRFEYEDLPAIGHAQSGLTPTSSPEGMEGAYVETPTRVPVRGKRVTPSRKRSEETELTRPVDGGGAGVDAEFLEDVGDVAHGRAGTEEEGGGDL